MCKRDGVRTPGGHGASRRRNSKNRLKYSPDRLCLLQSPSRGVDDPVNLLQRDVQDQYWESIVRKIQEHADVYQDDELTLPCNNHEHGVRCRNNSLQELLLGIRKLREGLVASHRMDRLTVQVYELTVFLSILCENQAQLASTVSRLVQEIYPAIPVSYTHLTLPTKA